MLKAIVKNAEILDRFLKKYFKDQKYSNLVIPMKYGVLTGGKKIRSAIILNTAKIFNLKLNRSVFFKNEKKLINKQIIEYFIYKFYVLFLCVFSSHNYVEFYKHI